MILSTVISSSIVFRLFDCIGLWFYVLSGWTPPFFYCKTNLPSGTNKVKPSQISSTLAQQQQQQPQFPLTFRHLSFTKYMMHKITNCQTCFVAKLNESSTDLVRQDELWGLWAFVLELIMLFQSASERLSGSTTPTPLLNGRLCAMRADAKD